MKKAHILHNPNAGSQEKSKKELVKLMKENGFDCGYSSTKKIAWKQMEVKTDFIVVAGGDGTVRNVAVKLIEKDRFKKHMPILLLPLGTANNVAKSLGITGHLEEVIENMSPKKLKKYDVGRVKGIKEEDIFLESFGFGLFPALMAKMKEIPEREDATPQENLERAQRELHTLVMDHPAADYTIKIDGTVHTGKYILVEVMNTPSLGPRLHLSPGSDPGDGVFELVMIPEAQREELATYVSYLISGIERNFSPLVVSGRELRIIAGPELYHVDDELKELKKSKKIKISPEPGMLEFFVQ